MKEKVLALRLVPLTRSNEDCIDPPVGLTALTNFARSSAIFVAVLLRLILEILSTSRSKKRTRVHVAAGLDLNGYESSFPNWVSEKERGESPDRRLVVVLSTYHVTV